MRGAVLISVLMLGLCGCHQVLLPPAPLESTQVSTVESGLRFADVAGYNCSLLAWAIGKPYCEPVLVPVRPQYCTRSLARVDCWDRPDPFGYHQRQVADGPWQLTPEQLRNSTRAWPLR